VKLSMPVYFAQHIEARAFRSSSQEYAWQRSDLPAVFEYCRANAIAILGGEAWVVRRTNDCTADEPSEPLHNLDLHRRAEASVLGRTTTYVIYGDFRLRDGRSAVFSWSATPRSDDQMWVSYVSATIDETQQMIERRNIEADIIPEYVGDVYFNLVFEREDGTSF